MLKNGDFLVIMDGDNTQNPKYIHSMLEKINKGNDCVIASRYQEGAKVKGLAAYREKLSDIAKIYYEVVLNIKGVKDYTCGYRIYTYDIINKVIKKFGKEVVKEKSFACMMELLYKVSRVDARIDEVPFELRYDNKNGTSKMKVFTTMRRSVTTAVRLQVKYNLKNVMRTIGITVLLVILPLLLSLITNFSPTNNCNIMHDCGIFSYIAYAMQNDLTMYTEAWDNKGPLLYLIYYFGFCLSGEFGVYLFEYLALLITTVVGYKTIKGLTNSKGLGIIGIIYSMCAWMPTHEQGTLSEVFALPFMTIGIYLFVKCVKNDIHLPKSNIILWGVCCAGLALLRLNILLVFLPLFIIIGILLIDKKEWKSLGQWLLYGIIGFAILVIPIAIYLLINGAFIECLNTAYLHILSGFDSGTVIKKITALKEMLLTFNKTTMLSIVMLCFAIIGTIALILKKVKERNTKILFIGIIGTILINLYSNGLSGAVQMHYFITFIPIVILTVAVLLYSFKVNWKDKTLKIIGIILIILSMLISLYNYVVFTIEVIEKKQSVTNTFQEELTQYIINNSEENDKVQFIGAITETTSVNYYAKRLSATRYNYLPLWGSFTTERKSEIVNEVVEVLMKEKPKLIIAFQEHEEYFLELIEDKEKWKNFLNTYYNKLDEEESLVFFNMYERK